MRERGSSGNHGSDQVKAASEDGKIGLKLAPFNPTGADAIAAAVDLLSLTGGDKLLDLGCGDGRLLVEVRHAINWKELQMPAASRCCSINSLSAPCL